MYLLNTFCVFFLFSFCVTAQNTSKIKINPDYIHQFIYELHYENAKTYILQHDSEVEEMRDFLSKNIYFIQYKTIPLSITKKLSSYTPIQPRFVQKKFNPVSFNPFLYKFEEVNEPKKIHIDGTNYVLFINPDVVKRR